MFVTNEQLYDYLERIDGGQQDVNMWEANFIESMFIRRRKKYPLTHAMRMKILEMAEKYLSVPLEGDMREYV